MSVSISCRELGMDCHFEVEAETEEILIDYLMRHIQMDHGEDWFELEESYQAAFEVVRKKAA